MGLGFSSSKYSDGDDPWEVGKVRPFSRVGQPVTKRIATGDGSETTVKIGALYRATFEDGRGVVFVEVAED